jgi:hypothetical protein
MKFCRKLSSEMYIYVYNTSKGGVYVGRGKSSKAPVERLDCDEEIEDGFSENAEPTGTVLMNFSFASPPEPVKEETLIDNRRFHEQPYGRTPPVDGEAFEIKRTFLFRRSTVRLLNRLKAEHENENAYLSSIVDEAIRHYYKQVFEEENTYPRPLLP